MVAMIHTKNAQWSDPERLFGQTWVRPRSDRSSPDRRVTLRLDADTHAALMDVPRGQRSAAIKRLIYAADDTARQVDSLQQTVATLTAENARLRETLAERDRQHSAQMAQLTSQVSQLTALVTMLISNGQTGTIVPNGKPAESSAIAETPPAGAVRPAPAPAAPVMVNDAPATPDELASATANFVGLFG